MRIKKIYFNRLYNQWKGEPLYVEDEKSEEIRLLKEKLAYEKSVNRHLLEEKGMEDIIKNYYKEE